MSFLSGIGKFLKKAAPVIGAVVGNAVLPGVGGVVGGSLGGAIAKAGKGQGVGDVLGGAAVGGLGAAGANAASAGPGFSLGGLKSGLMGGGGEEGEGALTGGGGLGSLFKDPLSIAKLGLAGAGLVQSAKASSKSGKIADQLAAENAAIGADRTKLRGLFMDNVNNLPTQRPDLGDLFQSQNAFARKRAA